MSSMELQLLVGEGKTGRPPRSQSVSFNHEQARPIMKRPALNSLASLTVLPIYNDNNGITGKNTVGAHSNGILKKQLLTWAQVARIRNKE